MPRRLIAVCAASAALIVAVPTASAAPPSRDCATLTTVTVLVPERFSPDLTQVLGTQTTRQRFTKFLVMPGSPCKRSAAAPGTVESTVLWQQSTPSWVPYNKGGKLWSYRAKKTKTIHLQHCTPTYSEGVKEPIYCTSDGVPVATRSM